MDSSELTAKEIILCIFFGICFIAYIVSLIRTRKKQMTTFVNWPEFAGSTFGCVTTLVGMMMILYSGKIVAGIVILLLGLAVVIFCAKFCLKANNKNYTNVIIATLAKFFVMFISLFAVLYIFRDKDKESISGSRLRNSITISIVAFLLFSLVGSGKHDELVKAAKENAPVL